MGIRGGIAILAALAAALVAGCVTATGQTAGGRGWGPATRIAVLQDRRISESSGIAISRRRDDLFWTHNDSGDKARLYAFDRKGRVLATFKVRDAKAYDWEDIASGPGPDGPALYIADIGDNLRERSDCCVYRVPEPVVGGTPGREVRETAPATRLRFRYPDGRFNAESLLVHPQSGEIYIATKGEKPAVIYRFPRPLDSRRRVTLERVATLPGIGTTLTAGDIAPDGRRLVLRDYMVAFEYRLPPGRPFAAIFATKPRPILLAREGQGEAIAYRHDGRALLTTSEGRPTPLNEMLEMRP